MLVSCFVLADVDRHVLLARVLADDHAGVDLGARLDEEGAAVLQAEHAVGHGLAGLHGDQGARGALGQLALVRLVAVEVVVEDAGAARLGR